MVGQLTVPRHPGPVYGMICKMWSYLLLDRSGFELKNIAAAAGVSERTLQNFVSGAKGLRKEKFAQCLSASPWGPKVSMRLEQMYDNYRKRSIYERVLDFYVDDFPAICEHPSFKAAYRELANLDTPGCLVDELFFDPVVNARLFAPFSMSEKWLRIADAWHSVAHKLHPDSPLLAAHRNLSSPYFTFVTHAFHERLERYVFTRQGIALQERLLHTAPEQYATAWLSFRTMLAPAWPWNARPPCVIWCSGQETRWVIERLKTVPVAIKHGPLLNYELLTWRPADDPTQEFLNDVIRRSRKELIFASDYGVTLRDLLYP